MIAGADRKEMGFEISEDEGEVKECGQEVQQASCRQIRHTVFRLQRVRDCFALRPEFGAGRLIGESHLKLDCLVQVPKCRR